MDERKIYLKVPIHGSIIVCVMLIVTHIRHIHSKKFPHRCTMTKSAKISETVRGNWQCSFLQSVSTLALFTILWVSIQNLITPNQPTCEDKGLSYLYGT